MTFLDSIILGVIQGITEFLPISSSGHLVVAQSMMGISQPGILFEVSVHLGTLLSILVIFFRDVQKLVVTLLEKSTQKYVGYLLIGTIPIVVVGMTMKESVEKAFENPHFVGYSFLFTGLVLLATKFAKPSYSKFSGWKSIIVGFFQAIALLPGVSRSGMTISSGLLLKIHAKEAAKFSFILAIPALIGSGVFMIRDFISLSSSGESTWILFTGFATSFVVGILALKLLLSLLMKGKFHWFGIYCLLMGFLTLRM
ncbi:MAG: undecaprenyl-diphosphate phosphatase [Candidatus Marinimicrobia bacterium]|nr:undecaprenyl-diphosphate phosphatase [Candidatus Neomarinimicrobiota bacterium]MBL7047041.1 undecaprenyl-diphosphate phosphatase [Candidatus Neomarinimicrobiota bacterium]